MTSGGAALRKDPEGHPHGSFPIDCGVTDRTAGEGYGRKSRGQVYEESHCGISKKGERTDESLEQ
jgi:hypothetical protein